MLRVVVFDDVVFARGETFHIPGLVVVVYPHADDASSLCTAVLEDTPDFIFMDFEMGSDHLTGAEAVVDLRAAGFRGKIIAISSDPRANQTMIAGGADDLLGQKAHLRSYLVKLGEQAVGSDEP